MLGIWYCLCCYRGNVRFGNAQFPRTIQGLAHVHANISHEEANELFLMFAKLWRYECWENCSDTLLKVSKLRDELHHVGTVMAGVRTLEEVRKRPGAAELVELLPSRCYDRSTLF